MRIFLEIAHVEFNMLLDELVLITLELQELFTIDDNTTHTTCTASSSIRRNEGDTWTPCIGSDPVAEPGLGFHLRSKSFRFCKSSSEEVNTISVRRVKSYWDMNE